MKKLILHSDQIPENTKIDEKFLSLFDHTPSITYIPSQSDDSDMTWFRKKEEYYQNLGVENLFYFDIDLQYNENKIEEAFLKDAIFLSGGNTFYFLNLLKKRNIINRIQEYVKNGGVLIGVSAGSILMSPTIQIAKFGDDNEIGIKDLSSLCLVDFDFYPHYSGDDDPHFSNIIEYSRKFKKVVYVCSDGDGVVIVDDRITLFGDVVTINKGKIINK